MTYAVKNVDQKRMFMKGDVFMIIKEKTEILLSL